MAILLIRKWVWKEQTPFTIIKISIRMIITFLNSLEYAEKFLYLKFFSLASNFLKKFLFLAKLKWGTFFIKIYCVYFWENRLISRKENFSMYRYLLEYRHESLLLDKHSWMRTSISPRRGSGFFYCRISCYFIHNPAVAGASSSQSHERCICL